MNRNTSTHPFVPHYGIEDSNTSTTTMVGPPPGKASEKVSSTIPLQYLPMEENLKATSDCYVLPEHHVGEVLPAY